MSTPLALRAWVDESGSDHARDPGTYILAAAVVSTIEEDTVRTVMSSLRMSQRKVHWRDEGTRRRQAIIEAIANTCIEHIVVVRQRIPAERRTERARRKCLERLITELEARGIHELVLESRGPSDDRRDIDMLNALRSQHRTSPATTLHHLVGAGEPMLWVPDSICGAISSLRTGDETYAAALGEALTIVDV